MTYLHDHGIGATRAGEKMGHEFDGPLRGRKANAREVPARQMVETFEREGKMGAALVVGYGVNFVHDDGFDRCKHFAASRRGQQDVERFWSGDQNVRRTRQHGSALMRERVAGAHGGANFRHEHAALSGELQNFAKGDFEVFLNVVAKRFERGHVKNFGAVG